MPHLTVHKLEIYKQVYDVTFTNPAGAELKMRFVGTDALERYPVGKTFILLPTQTAEPTSDNFQAIRDMMPAGYRHYGTSTPINVGKPPEPSVTTNEPEAPSEPTSESSATTNEPEAPSEPTSESSVTPNPSVTTNEPSFWCPHYTDYVCRRSDCIGSVCMFNKPITTINPTIRYQAQLEHELVESFLQYLHEGFGHYETQSVAKRLLEVRESLKPSDTTNEPRCPKCGLTAKECLSECVSRYMLTVEASGTLKRWPLTVEASGTKPSDTTNEPRCPHGIPLTKIKYPCPECYP